jgi:hypothetical protein
LRPRLKSRISPASLEGRAIGDAERTGATDQGRQSPARMVAERARRGGGPAGADHPAARNPCGRTRRRGRPDHRRRSSRRASNSSPSTAAAQAAGSEKAASRRPIPPEDLKASNDESAQAEPPRAPWTFVWARGACFPVLSRLKAAKIAGRHNLTGCKYNHRVGAPNGLCVTCQQRHRLKNVFSIPPCGCSTRVGPPR